MGKVTMILRKPPYGDINAAEAVRHALGAASSDLKVQLILVDGGTLLARKGQDDTVTGFTNLEATLKDCAEMGVEIYADRLSLMERSMSIDDLIEGVSVANESDIASMLKEAATTLIF